MYCNNCGKEIDSGTICNECAAAQASSAASTEEKAPIATPVAMTACEPTSEPVVPTKPVSTLPEPDNRMYGFSKALTSTILGVVGAVFAFISYFFALMSAEIIEAAPAAFLLTLLAIVLKIA